jgi:hypothetical protein
MPSFLIVHSASPDGRIDGYRQPPTLDIAGWRAPLDWGDVTLHVPAGDLVVTVFVVRDDGQVDGARMTLRTPAGTGTRLTFVPPPQPGGRSQLRIDGQWPADPSMHYYAARDARVLAAPQRRVPQSPAPQQATAPPQAVPQQSVPRQPARQQSVPLQPAPQRSVPLQPVLQPPPADHGVQVVSPAAHVAQSPAVAVGPTPGSSASVPQQPTPFGHQQGARVDPVQATGPRAQRAPQHPAGPTHPAPAPSFGQRHPDGREAAPPIPTPAEFNRLEEAAREAQVRAYEAWQAQQQAPQPAAPWADDGAPRPIGLGSPQAGQARPDWYPDPYRRADARWFDGQQWSASVMRGGVRGTDPLG